MRYLVTDEKGIIEQVDRLLYMELWKPLGFPEDIRKEFKAGTVETVVVALEAKRVAGAFVLVDCGDSTMEIRHAAVAGDFQNQAVGTKIFEKVLDYIAAVPNVLKITVHARNTSYAFWLKLGFVASSDWLEHHLFTPHGIRFIKMEYQPRTLR